MKLFWWVLGTIAWCVSPAWSQQEVLRLKQGSVEVVATSPFSEIPPSGYFPLSIRVGNGSRAPFNHGAISSATSSFSSNRANSFSQLLGISVPSGEDRTFQVLLPLANAGTQSYANSRIDFSLVENRSIATSYSGTRGPFIVATDDALGRRRSQVQSDVSGGGGGSPTFTMISVPPDMIPEDSRAWFGVDELWVTAAEWRAMRPSLQLSLRDWITRGGRIQIWGRELDKNIVADWTKAGGRDIKSGDDSTTSVGLGFGEVLFPVVAGDENAMVKVAVDYMKGSGSVKLAPLENQPTNLLSQQYTDWELFRAIPKLRVNVPLTILFVVVFAVLVGPINLFVFANAKSRYRMFWTTPLLSLGASFLLWLLIVVVDGFGAMGNRGTLIYVNGKENRASSFQEQVVRTGVLINRSFSLPAGVAIQPLRLIREEPSAIYGVSNGVYDGSWFASRALCGLYLETTDSFRGKLEIVNRAAFDAGNGKVAPEVVSSLPVPLKMLEIIDGAGKIWRASDVATGQRKTLDLASEGGFLVKQAAMNKLGPLNRRHLQKLTGVTRMFYASADGKGAFIDTLPGVRWDDESTFFVGSLD